MKKVLLIAISLFTSLPASAQMDIRWGERFYDILDDCKAAEIVAEDNNAFYLWYCLEEYIGQGESKLQYYFARTDKSGNVEKVVKIDFPHQSFKIEQTWRAGDCVGFILSRINEDKPVQKKGSKKTVSKTKTGTAHLYTQYFHLRDMRLMDKPQKINVFKYFAQEGEKPYLFNFSENKTKMVFCFFENDTTKGRSANIRVYDQRMNVLWEKTHRLNINNDAYQMCDVAVNNNGSEVLLAIRSYSTAKKVKHTDDKAHLVWLTQYEERTYEQQLEKAWPTDIKCAFNMEDDYLMAGYYGTTNDKPTLATGSFAYLYDNRRGYLKQSSTAEFRDYENDEMVAEGLPKPSDMTAGIRALVPMIGGNLIMVGEQKFISHIIPPKRRGDKPTGEEAVYFRDIIITNIDKHGMVSGNAYIPKRQKDVEGFEAYNSFAMTRDRYGIYIMFNDHIKNYDGNAFEAKKCYNADKLRTQVNFVQIFSDGSYRWSKAYDTKKNKMPFFQTLYLTTLKQIMFLGRYQDHNIIGTFELR